MHDQSDRGDYQEMDLITMHLVMASIHESEGKADAAIVEYSQVCEYDPEIFQVYINRGRLYSRLRQFKRAIRDFERASLLEPGIASPHLKLGDVYLTIGQMENAEAEYRKCLELAPDNLTATAHLNLVYDLAGDFRVGMSA